MYDVSNALMGLFGNAGIGNEPSAIREFWCAEIALRRMPGQLTQNDALREEFAWNTRFGNAGIENEPYAIQEFWCVEIASRRMPQGKLLENSLKMSHCTGNLLRLRLVWTRRLCK